jgi:N6-adenosine-specific RNA methylase IME4
MSGTRKQWAKRLNAIWRQAAGNMLEAIFTLGRELIEAKEGPDKLPHGEFQKMVREDLEFTPRTAQRFMKIANDKRLTKATHVSRLPPTWGTLYLISRLDDPTFDRLIEDGTIRRDMERGEISKVLRLSKVAADEQRVLTLRPKPGKYRTLVIDPAWEYDWLSLAGRAKPGYAMQTLDQLRALDLRQWADEKSGCHLYCWVTNNFMAEGCKLVAGWGFQHRTVLTWIKPPPFGLGSYFRNSTEHVLFATLGDTTTRHAAASIPTHFTAPRGEHSEKPEKFYEIVRAASYPPYGEGNQREPRPDFTNLFESIDATATAAECMRVVFARDV